MPKTTTTTTEDSSVGWAEQLWERLRAGLLDTQQSIIAIIEARAWEPLGYESFSKAWVDRMSDITIAAELRPHVVYELLTEHTVEDIADMIKGIGPDGVEELKRQKENGVSAGAASSRRRHRRVPAHRFLTIEMKPELLAAWDRKSERHNKTTAEIVLAAATPAFEALES